MFITIVTAPKDRQCDNQARQHRADALSNWSYLKYLHGSVAKFQDRKKPCSFRLQSCLCRHRASMRPVTSVSVTVKISITPLVAMVVFNMVSVSNRVTGLSAEWTEVEAEFVHAYFVWYRVKNTWSPSAERFRMRWWFCASMVNA